METHINDPNTQKQINEIYPPWDEEKELKNTIKEQILNESEKEQKDIKKNIQNYNREQILEPIFSQSKTVDDVYFNNIIPLHKNILHAMSQKKGITI